MNVNVKRVFLPTAVRLYRTYAVRPAPYLYTNVPLTPSLARLVSGVNRTLASTGFATFYLALEKAE